jgi:hypothetical protein
VSHWFQPWRPPPNLRAAPCVAAGQSLATATSTMCRRSLHGWGSPTRLLAMAAWCMTTGARYSNTSAYLGPKALEGFAPIKRHMPSRSARQPSWPSRPCIGSLDAFLQLFIYPCFCPSALGLRPSLSDMPAIPVRPSVNLSVCTCPPSFPHSDQPAIHVVYLHFGPSTHVPHPSQNPTSRRSL